MKEAIRLTNKTAIALRKSAQRMRSAHYCAAVLLSVLMAAVAVYVGIKWLPAVPIMVTLCVLLDCAIVVRARSCYLSLIGQAICTEAAAREIRFSSREQKRKERAVSDLMEMKADIKKPAAKKMGDTQPFFEKGTGKPLSSEEMGNTMSMSAVKMKAEHEQEADAPRRRRADKSLQLIR